MTDELTRIDALRLLLAKHEPDGLIRALSWSYKRHDDRKLRIASRAWVEQVRASWDRRTA